MSQGWNEIKCPKCKKLMSVDASKCPHCTTDFTDAEVSARKKEHRNNMLGGCGLLIVIILALGWCASNNEPATPNADEISFIDMPGLANYAMYIPAGTDPDKLVDSAKSKCGTQEICSVFGWIDRNDMARMLPMTDREVETQTFKYGVNRTTGFEQRLWDCRLYPGKKRDECL